MERQDQPTSRTTFLASLAGFVAAGFALGSGVLRRSPGAALPTPDAPPPEPEPARIPINPPAHSVKRRG